MGRAEAQLALTPLLPTAQPLLKAQKHPWGPRRNRTVVMGRAEAQLALMATGSPAKAKLLLNAKNLLPK